MKYWHCILVLAIGYALGVYFPSFGTSAVSKAKGLVGA